MNEIDLKERSAPARPRAVAFDLDAPSLASLRKALPEWKIDWIDDATAASIAGVWKPGAPDLLVVSAREEVTETLALCRVLVSCGAAPTNSRGKSEENRHGSAQEKARQVGAPLIVLVSPGQERLVMAVLKAGADSCLMLPVHAKELARMVARGRRRERPGRHTLSLQQAQRDDRWQDNGGQG
jgi:PleD family two-component response regulator